MTTSSEIRSILAVVEARMSAPPQDTDDWTVIGNQLTEAVKLAKRRAKALARPIPNRKQLEELAFYKRRHGRAWKASLLADWESGTTRGLLQEVRNSFGPTWLMSFQPSCRCSVATTGYHSGDCPVLIFEGS